MDAGQDVRRTRGRQDRREEDIEKQEKRVEEHERDKTEANQDR